MTWTVRIAPDAETDFESSVRWYGERAGLRAEFIEAIDEAVFAIAEAPYRYPHWQPQSAYRKYVVDRFPYVVVYRVLDEYVEVVAFAHARRRPGYWLQRR